MSKKKKRRHGKWSKTKKRGKKNLRRLVPFPQRKKKRERTSPDQSFCGRGIEPALPFEKRKRKKKIDRKKTLDRPQSRKGGDTV